MRHYGWRTLNKYFQKSYRTLSISLLVVRRWSRGQVHPVESVGNPALK
jgi:hypothetical protein